MTNQNAELDSYHEEQPELYTWRWGGDGYNQAYAISKEEALEKAKEISPKLFPSLHNLKVVRDIEAFWANYPLFD